MNDFDLTEEQQAAVDLIVEFLDSDRDVLTMAGIGGAGKTTCIREALHGRSNIVGATISHSAKFVLENSLKGMGSCNTIAQLLGLRMSITEDGKIIFVPRPRKAGRPLPIETATILIIDECSMIDDETYNRIMSLKRSYTKVIFLGDRFQLPPVQGDTDSATFNHTAVTLEKAMRYSGPIADLGMRIRNEIEKCDNDEHAVSHFLNEWMDELGEVDRVSQVNEDGSGYIFLNDIDDVINIAVEQFKNNEDPDAMRLIAFRNSSIKKINSVIRAQLYCDGDEDNMDDLPQYMPGELVICNGGHNIMENDARYPTPVLYNNQTFKVLGTQQVPNGPNSIPSLAMNLEPHPTRLPRGYEILTIDHEEGRYQYYEMLNQLKANAKEDTKQWPIFHSFDAQWAKFEYSYAINSHKGQGRTFTDAIVFERDIFNVKKSTLKSKLQAMYVACTRAKRRVFIYNEKYRVDQSNIPEQYRKELGL